MPELPEVETFRRMIAANSLHRTVHRVEVLDRRILSVSPRRLSRSLKGSEFVRTRRIGKHLFIELSSGAWLTVHFGMSGSANIYDEKEERPEYAQLLLHMADGVNLAFACPRRMEKVGLAESVDEFIERERLGPDALELELREFRALLSDRKGGIKGALTDQHLMSGIGNIYADEILFQARVHPAAQVPELDRDQVKSLFTKMRSVLRTAIDRKARSEEYPRTYLTRRRKEGERCPRCEGRIDRITVHGRSTYFCPSCQKA